MLALLNSTQKNRLLSACFCPVLLRAFLSVLSRFTFIREFAVRKLRLCCPLLKSIFFFLFCAQLGYAAEPIKVKVFIGAMFEIGENTGDKSGEF